MLAAGLIGLPCLLLCVTHALQVSVVRFRAWRVAVQENFVTDKFPPVDDLPHRKVLQILLQVVAHTNDEVQDRM